MIKVLLRLHDAGADFVLSAQSSLGSCLGVYVLVAACGYALYGSEVHSDVLKSFPQSNWLLILGTLLLPLWE